MKTHMLFNTKAKVETELSLYEKRRKLEIDEALSEYRRKSKNDAVGDVKTFVDGLIRDNREMFSEGHEADKTHALKTAQRTAEILALDEQKAAKQREIDQAQTDYDARGLLRERASKAEREKYEAVAAEKDKHIAHIEAHNKILSEQNTGLLTEAVKHLGVASSKDSVTKVVGFGPSSEPKKV